MTPNKEPSTTAEEFEKWFAETWPEKSAPPATEKLAYLSGFDEGKRIGREEEMARTVRLLGKKDAEITTLQALLHDEAKDYAETIMKLCEECGVESIQDIGPKLAELKAEHDRLQEDLCEKVVSEGGKLEAELTRLQERLAIIQAKLAESERKAAGMASALKDISSVSRSELETNPEHWLKMCIGRAQEAIASPSPAEEVGLVEEKNG